MGRIGTTELILILAIALIVVGPSKLPELGKSLGKTIKEFKKFSSDIKEDLTIEETPVKKKEETVAKTKENEELNEEETKED